ncbi:diacyglycerol O-acyltransferase [Rhodococcus aetherivorans]|uniref:Diacylglycerol O-acyltransferase n=1 Tax=Rhodococcus aetherivorans TaxID=191292 RepID=A0ABQ0YJF8_9NOCA|nr:wax ester/triacylglycerol synthase family O-acyltransferase [Rhodococcus aetherivorans]NGP28837.1 wax ester/triacylglycerol synthase family O-acyltransferase [Rhodococcus aetherivorans]GES36616.1 diacyglycerol O-acyltransferase [Rhodococcus aetherivorans]
MGLMDPIDAVLMTAELLANPMHVAVVLILDPPEDAGPRFVDDAYRDALGRGGEVDPVLRRRAHRGVDTGGWWAWRDVDDIDLSYHVRRASLPPGAGRDELWQLVGALHAEPLDRSRPMWEAHLVDGLPDGRYALYIKVHHAVLDGIAGLRMIEESMSPDPDRRSMSPFFATGGRDRPGSAHGGLPTPLALARSAVGTVASGMGLVRRTVEGQVRSTVQGLTTDTTVLPFAAPRTRLNGPLGAGRTFAAAGWPKARLRAIQHAAGVTGNDVVTAVVAGALRSWFAEHDELPGDSLVAICPVSVRGREDGGTAGNAFGTAVCTLGTDLADPADRLGLIHRSMQVAKERVASLGPVPSLLVAAPSILPTILLPMLPFDPRVRPGYNLPISNVPGPRTELYWNGAHLEEIYPVSIVYDGMALNVTVCSYADRVGFGYVAGGEVIPDIEALIPLTERSLSQLEAAVGVAP